jgi:hypothetical protein
MLVVLGSLLSVLCVPSILVLHKDPLFRTSRVSLRRSRLYDPCNTLLILHTSAHPSSASYTSAHCALAWSAALQFGQCSSSSADGLELGQLEGRGSACSAAELLRLPRLFQAMAAAGSACAGAGVAAGRCGCAAADAAEHRQGPCSGLVPGSRVQCC